MKRGLSAHEDRDDVEIILIFFYYKRLAVCFNLPIQFVGNFYLRIPVNARSG